MNGFFAALRPVFACAALLACGVAAAADFPVAGSISFNGSSGALPDGGTFGPSSYAAGSGAIAPGSFTFPQATAQFSSTFGTVVVTYHLSQTDTSSGQVEVDGSVTLADAAMKLEVLHVTVGGVPVGVGTCVFQPIVLTLAGTASATSLDLADNGFVVPPVGASDCGGFASQINAALAGSNNNIELHVAGDFTPPTGNDTIFANGFDP